MKKISAILMSVMMLLAFASCDGEKENTGSETSSQTSSEVSSEPSSETPSESADPNAPLTADEIARYLAAGQEMNEASAVDVSAVMEMTIDMMGTKVTTTVNVNSVQKGEESYTETITNVYGVEAKEIVYFKDGKYYTISEVGGESYGYYEEMTYEEAFGAEEGEETADTVFVLNEETLADAKVERMEDGSVKLVYDGDNEDFLNNMNEIFAGTTGAMEDEGSSVEFISAAYTIVFDENAVVTSMKIELSMLVSGEEEGLELSMGHDIVMDMTLNAYGDDADITVPVPENLDDCEKLDYGEEF